MAQKRLIISTLIFLTAFGIGLLVRNNKAAEAPQVQSGVAENYKHLARLLVDNGFTSFFNASSPTANPDLLGHPPGYSMLLSIIYRIAGESDVAVQLFQLVCQSLCAVLIFLIAAELLPLSTGAIAGFIAAVAPQFGWNSILLLPDTLAALPLLLAVYLITRAQKKPFWVRMLLAGGCIGLSCWLRANGLLLAFFLAVVVLLVFSREVRVRMALALVAGFLLAIAPLAIRNAIVFGHFIPVSLGAGQTLLEGIADYDPEGKFGLPNTDMGLIEQEAMAHNRPDYAQALFGPDAIKRDRERLARGFAIIRAHPLWFLSVMVRRAADMWRLERVPLISRNDLPSGLSRYVYLLLRMVQRLFITAVILPLVLIGLVILIRRRQFQVLGILLAVPGYYFCVQSILHTEYRYVLTLHYFLFVFAAVAIHQMACFARGLMLRKVERG
ncbi:MAG TPA: glycosyltransferase family 39 protein [Pyrinomonadaceae bacterium]|nr:glycosyltransferase family 39 protein [Pyrinomonadaceae bacterium]